MSKSDKKKFVEEVHHRVIKKFPRRHVFVTGLDEIWAMDLISYETDLKANDGYRFILCVIDVFSKFAWCIPLKSKSSASVLQAVKDIILKSKRSPQKFWVDHGTEFYNADFKDWIKSQNMSMYSTYGESKSVVVERFIRTIKTMISKVFTLKNTHNWLSIL
ncbi:MAG TPA: transposase family protein, partial [Candidatus Dojkabacteria bacterium]|nr:transposase family protein [Candidatus Dojkabacteria bacterium]